MVNYPDNIYKILFCFLFLLTAFNGIGQESADKFLLSPLAPAPPTVVSPVKYCQNAPTWSLSSAVTVTPGCTLLWYGQNATGGTGTPTPSVVDTTILGSYTYYVSQINATGESTRAAITVNIVTLVKTNLFCDGAQSTNTNVAFDWSNITGYGLYHYTYSINGGPPVSGTQLAPSHFNVPVAGPNTPVTFTITAVDNFPCYQPETVTCAKCTTTVTPTFGTIQNSFCQGSTAPSPLPTTSTNGITGTWSPAFSTATAGTVLYTFTPTASPCSNSFQKSITVTAPVTPAFAAITPICSGSAAPVLPTTSTNGITGTWSPATVSNTTSGNYTFTPNAGQCVTSTPVVLNVTVNPLVTPNFAAIAPICSGSTAPGLSNTSPNGIVGTWSPATINNTTGGNYTFTPNAGQCATNQVLNVVIKPIVIPNFQSTLTLCSGSPAPALATTSPNGVTGTWSPATINNATGGSYTFTPSAGQCSPNHILTVSITPRVTPNFASAMSLCVGSTPPALSNTSPNGITGAWSPSTINTSIPGVRNYTFTAAASECVTSPTHVLTVTVNALTIPDFAQIGPICAGSAAPLLPATSPNGVVGTWSPSTISNTTSGNYTFTPAANQCSVPQVMNISVKPVVVPNFPSTLTLCSGSAAPTLATTSPNGVTGTWSPATINNTLSGSYVFTPTAGQCSPNHALTVTITPRISPDFQSTLSICVGSTPPALATTSPNGISGTWSPAAINTSAPGVANYTFTAAASECVNSPTHVLTVTVNARTVPDFPAIAPICFNSVAPVLSNTSPNGVVGTWSPATISNTTSATYTFSPALNQCATSQVLNVTVKPIVTPNFLSTITLCSGATAPVLANTSPNGVTGTWSPAAIDNINSGTYTFTPNAGQCSPNHVLTVNITPLINPDFQSALSICNGSPPPALATTSPNGISGTWSPATISTAAVGVTNYTFTAAAGECVISPTFVMTVTVTPITVPDFAPIPDFCEDTPAPVLSNTSPNGIVGTWSPAVISNTTSGFYLFTAAANQCASSQILEVHVIRRTIPTFSPIPAFCSGSTAPVLPLVSNNGITGTWSPATVDNTQTATYLFVPDAPQCATTANFTVTVIQPIDPGFSDIVFCENAPVPDLETVSPLGIHGTWNPAVIDPSVSGATYVFTPDANECANPQTITVTVNQLTLNDVTWTVTNYFSDSATVIFTATDAGNYLYQLDFGPLYESNVFTNVAPGIHSVTVYDANGCAPPITKQNEVIVIDYPHYFSPNGDGIADYWNIFDLNLIGQSQASIFIFDRYGKLLKQIAPAGEGWDGTYNGEPMPSTDYWFMVRYTELNKPREFKAHFSLKR